MAAEQIPQAVQDKLDALTPEQWEAVMADVVGMGEAWGQLTEGGDAAE